MTYESLIQKRISVRNFDNKRPVSGALLETIETILTDFSSDLCRFQLVQESLAGVKLGTYGMISGAESYVVGIVGSTDKEVVIEFGRRLELIVLALTRLDLGTCWMAGTYNPSQFKSQIALSGSEQIAIVTPVGFASEKTRLRDRLLAVVVKPRNRKPFESIFFTGSAEKPMTPSDAGRFFPVLESVRQAPSASNKQPWRIVRDGSNFHFYTVRESISTLHGIFYGWNDLGIAKAHFDLVAREQGFRGTWKTVQTAVPVSGWEYCFSWIGE